MPIEIKELHIRVTVNQPASEGAASTAAGNSATADDKDALIRQCIEQVMDLMNAKKER
jgi:hypothetical protein